jgi:Xaa-Pro aminopeptidase
MSQLETSDPNYVRMVQARRQNIMRLMGEQNLDAVILTGYDNIRYATDLLPSQHYAESYFDECATIVDSNGDCYVISRLLEHNPDRSFIQARPWIKEIIPGGPENLPAVYQADIWVDLLSKKLSALRAKTVGVELLFSQIYEKLRARTPDVQYKSIFDRLLEIRAVKHSGEVRLLEKADAITDDAVSLALRLVSDGSARNEQEISVEIMKRMWELGAEYLTHNYVISGKLQDDRSSPKGILRKGMSIFFDIGCVGPGGYVSDITRCAFVGKGDPKLLDAYETLKQTFSQGVGSIGPGSMVSEVHSKMANVLSEAGYRMIADSLGHGIGLRMMELPYISRAGSFQKDLELKAGMVICVEPNLLVDGALLVIESEVLVTETGNKVLTKTPVY